MADNAKLEKAPKTSWFEGLKAEFGKIVWPDKRITCKTDCSCSRCISCSRFIDCSAGYIYPVWY